MNSTSKNTIVEIMVFYFDCKKRMNETIWATKRQSDTRHTSRNKTNCSQPPVRSKSMIHERRKKLVITWRRIAVALVRVVFIYQSRCRCFNNDLLMQRYYGFGGDYKENRRIFL
jgi:hypothetical protein